MTINNFRHNIDKDNSVECFGMTFRLLDRDIVHICLPDNVLEMTFEEFKTANKLPDNIDNLEITHISMKLIDNENNKLYALEIDTNKRDSKDISSVQAGMKFI